MITNLESLLVGHRHRHDARRTFPASILQIFSGYLAVVD
uniref:Uncharacterized protein n=1 Tax=Setaria italica TaxID=4555 RepID=K3ZG95_SETIT